MKTNERAQAGAAPGGRWLTAALMACALSLVASSAFADKPGDAKKAKELFEQGVSLSDEGRWAEALDSFQKSDEMVPSANVRFNVATTLRALGRYVEARKVLDQLLGQPPSAKPPIKPQLRKDIEGLRKEVAEKIVVVKVLVDPADAEVQVDGAPLSPKPDGTIELDPGKHVFVVKKEGFDTTSVTETLGARDKQVSLKAPPSKVVEKVVEKPVESEGPFYSKFWFWATAGAVVAGAAVVVVVVATRDDKKEPPAPPSATLDRVIPTMIRF